MDEDPERRVPEPLVAAEHNIRCALAEKHERAAHRTETVLDDNLGAGALDAEPVREQPGRQVVALADACR